MSHADIRSAVRPQPDPPMRAIADYVADYRIESQEAYDTARTMLLDSLACAALAMDHPACVRHLGPLVPGAELRGGARVPFTAYELDPVQAAYNIGVQIRWLDFNDTWLAAEWGHPSDNLGAILAVADYLGRRAEAEGGQAMTVGEVLGYAIKAHEIQGGYALRNSFNRVGLDHVILVRLASAAVATAMLGGGKDAITDAVSQAWIDNGSLRAYRHAPNTGPRKSWAAGDACRRAVTHALDAVRGEPGYPSALSAPTWGFYDVAFGGRPFEFERPFGSYVMENILFKISYPAEFHAQTAVECAMRLHGQVRDRLDDIERIELRTQEAGARIIDKTGPLANYADRDHCLQYMVAVPLIFGRLTADDYTDAVAADPRIDALREKMRVAEHPPFSRDYYDPDKRYIGNSVQVFFRDGSATENVSVDYPVGHRKRRAEGGPLLMAKFEAAVRARLAPAQADTLLALAAAPQRLDALPITGFLALLRP
ncbi:MULTISPECIES: bifunctional 2-methylcitrate dehydratase/aconitate hydratase [unclassified Lysobacter]|uniref:bifunctional 2-methylcitrate dehydratase/aconitate hydratase n=1 Tax=unclassified Lysobacter TaxID=2635362 RepID=UPI0006F7B4B6|nr:MULTISPECIES: bifunctional 2-methylcitrate dehydratase/aconitate hydratase [unclassified Lysobacter]KQZ62834.1 2-methylcitrate dehydratase [Lysobacter sp. Root559]KRC37257.1 2-methylcitrate dehydratase [Lysobacter sp. Root76]KRD67749.1 2-methylcitrate dehydratase [Lysobacter sp. Root96]